MFSISYIWFFVGCAIVFGLIIAKSVTNHRKKPRLTRSVAYWVVSAGLFILFGLANIGVIESIIDNYDGGRVLAYAESGIYDAVKGNSIGSETTASIDTWSDGTDSLENRGVSMTLTSMTKAQDSWVQVSPEGAKAGHSLKKYFPTMMIDGKISTSWQVTVDDPESFNNDQDQKEWVYFGFNNISHIDYIVIYNGTPDTEKRYYKNGRARQVRFSDISPDSKGNGNPSWTTEIELDDEPSCQIIECKNLDVRDLCMHIETMYAGSSYPELCITDVMFYSVK